jgi:iron complex outermembrane recepter protein
MGIANGADETHRPPGYPGVTQHKTSNTMNKLRSRKLTAATALLAATTLSAVPAYSQVAPTAPANDEELQELEKFVVTGSYIPTTETAFTAGASPVVRLDRKVIDQSGFASTAELLQRVTISNAGSVPLSNNATGFTPAATSLSLRGLGPEATLVLINGRRVAVYPVGTGGTTAFVDLNTIPLSAVDSIEVLKDGASALYGADAVAGVVNIKMRRGIDGSEAAIWYGNTMDEDASEVTGSFVTGAQTERANVLIGANYRKRNAIFARDRAYSETPPFLSTNSSPLNLQITRQAAIEAGVPESSLPAGNTFYANSGTGTNNNGMLPASAYQYSAGRSSFYNFNETAGSYPERDNIGGFAFAERKLFGTENIYAYLDTSYQRARTVNELAPSATGNFSGSGVELVIPARTPNPLPLPGRTGRAAAAGAYNPFNPFNVDITGGTRARLAEFGNRIYRNETDAFLVTFGVRGENIIENWNFDAAFSYSQIQDASRHTLVSASRVNRLMNAADPIFDPSSSEYLGTQQPYNPFGYYRNPIANNQALVNWALVDVKDLNESELGQFTFVVSNGELLQLPAGPIGIAFGGDVRHEELNQYPDPYNATGDVIGSSPNATTRGQRWIGGVFMEAQVPILSGTPGAHSLSANLAVRHEKFMTSDRDVTVPKVGLRWQPIDETLTVRSSWSKGFREPSLYELYSTPTASLSPIRHPLTGVVEPEQDVTVAGNRRLGAERTKSLNFGVVWSPKIEAIRGLTLSVDYWQIERRGRVDNNYQDTVNRFFGRDPDGNTVTGGLLPGESVVLFPDGSIRTVNSVFFNVGQTKVKGWDFGAEYRLETERIGVFTLGGTATFTDSFRESDAPGQPLEELVGTATDETSDDAYLEWRTRVTLEWAYRGFSTLIGSTFNDGFTDYLGSGDERQVASTWIWDAQISYLFRGDEYGPWLRDTRVSVGARNLFDKDPPFASGYGGNSNGYPGFIYNSEGRFLYVSLSKKF